jgi:hypothetical protein
MSKKAAIPTVKTGRADLDQAMSAIKQNLDAMTGQARNVRKLAPLPATASLADVIAQVNAISERLQ